MWMTSWTGSVRRGFCEIWKKSVELRTRIRTERVDSRGSLRPDEFVRFRHRTWWGGGRWKGQNRKNVYLSPYVEEPLNSKVIKSFVPELRSRKCFSCFGIPMFYVYMLWTFYVRFTYPYLAMVHEGFFSIATKSRCRGGRYFFPWIAPLNL